MVLFFTSSICSKSCAVYTPPASISLAICRWCDICILNIRNKDVVVVVVVSLVIYGSNRPAEVPVFACSLLCDEISML